MEQPKVIILAGGFGVRLRSVDSENPKPMVSILGKPFLFWLIASLVDQGLKAFIISTGYKAEIIEDFNWNHFFPHCQFSFSRESTPLGTGGAIEKILSVQKELKKIWVVNGDTILENKLPQADDSDESFYTALKKEELFDAFANLVCVEDTLIKILDVEDQTAKYFDAGAVYLNLTRLPLDLSRQKPFSLHRLLDSSIENRKVKIKKIEGTCYDVGTPARFKRFENELKNGRFKKLYDQWSKS